MNIESSYANVRTFDEAIQDAGVPDKQTEEYVEAEVLPEGSSGTASEKFETM